MSDCIFTLKARVELLQDCNMQMKREIAGLENALAEERARIMQLTKEVLAFKVSNEKSRFCIWDGNDIRTF